MIFRYLQLTLPTPGGVLVPPRRRQVRPRASRGRAEGRGLHRLLSPQQRREWGRRARKTSCRATGKPGGIFHGKSWENFDVFFFLWKSWENDEKSGKKWWMNVNCSKFLVIGWRWVYSGDILGVGFCDIQWAFRWERKMGLFRWGTTQDDGSSMLIIMFPIEVAFSFGEIPFRTHPKEIIETAYIRTCFHWTTIWKQKYH